MSLAVCPELLHMWRTLDLPAGWKAEIADGCLRLTPPPGDVHNNIADLVNKALVKAAEMTGASTRPGACKFLDWLASTSRTCW